MSKEQALAIAYQLATTELNPNQPGGIEGQMNAAIGSLQLAYDVVTKDIPKRDRIGIWRTAKKNLEERYPQKHS